MVKYIALLCLAACTNTAAPEVIEVTILYIRNDPQEWRGHNGCQGMIVMDDKGTLLNICGFGKPGERVRVER